MLFKANPTAVLYVKQMCEIQIRTIVTPIKLVNRVSVQCKTYSLIWQGIGDHKNTQIIPKSHYQIM